MRAYHEVSPDGLGSVLANGLKRTSRGDKSDKIIAKTDAFLDAHRPKYLKDNGVSRDDNVYGYVAVGDAVIDITDGRIVPIREFVAQSKQAVLELDVDAQHCYVSDLDTYDALQDAITNYEDNATLEKLAVSYWKKVMLLADFSPQDIVRPEYYGDI